MRRLSRVLAVLLTLIYPLAVWLAEGHIEPRLLAGLLLLAGMSRLSIEETSRGTYGWLAGTLLLVFLAVSVNAMYPLKLYPVLVNATLLVLFGYSLIFPPSAVERIARRRQTHLPARAINYARRVTEVWCIFFLVNGAIAFYTALYASSAIWSLYNGLLAYIFMGLLFAGEFCVRRCIIGPEHA